MLRVQTCTIRSETVTVISGGRWACGARSGACFVLGMQAPTPENSVTHFQPSHDCIEVDDLQAFVNLPA
jgi:hypothetical protein